MYTTSYVDKERQAEREGEEYLSSAARYIIMFLVPKALGK